jgi:heme exporter protein C
VSHSPYPFILALWGATVVAMVSAITLIFLHAPEEQVMGAAQKIFYFHVPAALATYAGVVLLLAGSIGYLWTRDGRWDHLSRSATEVGLLFCTLVLITGPIWAKPAWGTWWTWEARLTTTLILWLLLLAGLVVRDRADSHDLGARLAAIVGLVAALDVPIIHKAVEWWRGQHPQVFNPDPGDALEPRMRAAFAAGTLAILLLFALLVTLRYRIAAIDDRGRMLDERRVRARARGGFAP